MAGNALKKLTIAQSEMNARALESKPWDPPPKNSGNTSGVYLPTPDWQGLLEYVEVCLSFSKLCTRTMIFEKLPKKTWKFKGTTKFVRFA